MPGERRPYSRVYWSIVDDPAFERVYRNSRALAMWLRMLLVADAMYPASAPCPPSSSTLSLLIECSLVQRLPGNRYTIRGLEAERERRSGYGRNAAAMRWQSASNADAMPRRDETRLDKTSRYISREENGRLPARATAAKPGLHVGQHPNCTVCGTVPRASSTPTDEPRQISASDRAALIADNRRILDDAGSFAAAKKAAAKSLERMGVDPAELVDEMPPVPPRPTPKAAPDA